MSNTKKKIAPTVAQEGPKQTYFIQAWFDCGNSMNFVPETFIGTEEELNIRIESIKAFGMKYAYSSKQARYYSGEALLYIDVTQSEAK